jgi:NitT/TauT family transport system permease protein
MSTTPMQDRIRLQNPIARFAADFVVMEKPLSFTQRLLDSSFLRKSIILATLLLIWQIYAVHLGRALLFPTFTSTVEAFAKDVSNGVLPERALFSLKLLLKGYLVGIFLTAIFSVLAITTRVGRDALELLVAMFNPLPAIALLPLALIWFGLGEGGIVFVIVHSVLWAVALNTHSGFMAVSPTLRLVGRNYGLRGPRYVWNILIPAAAGSILTGLRLGWAFAWRTLIAAELVFGVASGSGGLGWYIYESKNELAIANVFAGLLSVTLIGLFVENVVFRLVENRTIARWGMHA